MNYTYDKEAQAGYCRVNEAAVAYTVELDDSTMADYDASGNLVGVEVLGPSLQQPALDKLIEQAKKASKGPKTSGQATPTK